MRSVPRGRGDGYYSGDGRLHIDEHARRLSIDGHRVPLTRTQFSILMALAQQPDRVMTREDIMSAVWGHTYFSNPDHLSVHVHHIHRAITDSGGIPGHIETVRGVGYMFVSDPRAHAVTVTLHFDPDSKVLAIVPFTEFLGWSPDVILGRYFSVAGLNPEQSTQALAILRSAKVLHGTIHAVRGDGSRHSVIVTASLDDTFVPDGYKGTIVYAEDPPEPVTSRCTDPSRSAR